MFQLGIDTIRERATNGPTYMKGRAYYRDGHLKNLTYDPDKGVIQAQVTGTRVYQVRIILTRSGELHDASCTCNAFSTYWGFCKHIVAVMLYCVDHFGRERTHIAPTVQPEKARLVNAGEPAGDASQSQRRSRMKARDFVSRMHRVSELVREGSHETIRFRTILYCSTTSLALPFISFAIGTDHLFPVTSVEQFAEAISRDRVMELDPKFTYDPLKHRFHPDDVPLVRMIQDAFENDYKSVFGSSHSSAHDRFMPLNASRFANLLAMAGKLTECRWRSVKDDTLRPVLVKSEPLPLTLVIDQDQESKQAGSDGEHFRLVLRTGQPLIQMTASRNVYLCGDHFYLPPRDSIRLVEPLLSVFGPGDQQLLKLNRDDFLTFMDEIRPTLEMVCPVLIEPALAERLVTEPLSASIALDWQDDRIRADVLMHYGDAHFNPLQSVSTSAGPDTLDDRLVIRDTRKETAIISRLMAHGFVRQGPCLKLSDPDLCHDFLQKGDDALEGFALITKTPAMDRLRVLPAPRICYDVRLAADSQSLSVFTVRNGLSGGDYTAYLRALREKRRYIRLEDGSFLTVDPTVREPVLMMSDALSLYGADPAHAQIDLPQYRALALSNIIKDSPGIMTADDSFHAMVDRIQNLGSLKTRVPSLLAPHLRPYQKTGFKWLMTLDHFGLGGILADDMGLGKTLQTLAYIVHRHRELKLPSLVVAPTSLVYNWLSEAEKFAPGLPVLVIDGQRSVRGDLWASVSKQALVITSYSLLRRDIDLISAQRFASCFIDEAQNIKNPDTLNARSVKQVQARRYFALTGTPIENSLTELWSLFDFILPGYLFSRSRFQEIYEWPIQRDDSQESVQALHRQIAPFILRRMKTDVLKELPDKIETRTVCDMTEGQREVYQQFLSQARHDFEAHLQNQGLPRSQMFILTLLTRLRQICCHPVLCQPDYAGSSGKLQLLEELLEDSFSSGHRVLVFSAFTSMLEIIRANQRALGREPFYIDGQVMAEDRLSQVQRFNDGEGELFLISLRSGGTGLNLTGADTVIHYDPWWNPAVEEQATDRAYRIGQENVVQVFKLITRQSIEEKIFHLQQQKRDLMDAVVQPGQNFLSQMSVEEIRSLFDF